MSPPLTIADFEQFGPLKRIQRFCLFDEIDSTNKYLLDNAADLADGTVATAEVQSAGRGRQGRAWLAPRGSSVLLSVLVHERANSALLTYAAMLGAVAATEAIAAAVGVDADLRWPNDLCFAGRKVAGVLAQSTSLWCGGARGVVIGIGINVRQRPEDFEGELAQKATALEFQRSHADRERGIDRGFLAGALAARLDHWLAAVRDADAGVWARLLAAWRARCRDVGSRVTLVRDGQTYHGTIAAIADDGDLFVDLETGERKRFGAATTTRNW